MISTNSETDKLSSQLVFPQNKLLAVLINNLRFNNFLCMSASIYVFITLTVSTSVLSVTELFKTLFKIDLAISFASDVVFCC